MSGQILVDTSLFPFQAIKARTDFLEILASQRQGEGGGVSFLQDPLQVRIFSGIQFGQRMLGPRQDTLGDGSFDVAKKTGVPA